MNQKNEVGFLDQFTIESTWLIVVLQGWCDQEQNWRTLDYNFICNMFHGSNHTFKVKSVMDEQIRKKKVYKTEIITSLVSPKSLVKNG